MSSIDITINKQFISVVEKICRLNSDYADMIIQGNQGVIAAEGKGVIFAGKFKVNIELDTTNLRLPVQILRQISSRYGTLRIFINDNKLSIFLFYTDVSKAPVEITMVKSISSLDYLNLIMPAINDPHFGEGALLPKCMPALNYIVSKSSGLNSTGLSICNGIVCIDGSTTKFFVDTKVPELNIVIPDFMLKHICKGKGTGMKHGYINGYHIMELEDFYYCWRGVRNIPISEYEALQKLSPMSVYGINIASAVEFISGMKIAPNREQVCTIDLASQNITVTESDISSYKLPISVQKIYDNSDGNVKQKPEPMNPLDTSPISIFDIQRKGPQYTADMLNVDVSAFLASVKDISEETIGLAIYSKFILLSLSKSIKDFGDIELKFLIKKVKV